MTSPTLTGRTPPAIDVGLVLPGLDAGAGSPWCQRWTHRQHAWRHLAEGGFDARRYTVEPIPDPDAAAFVRAHHYSGQFVAALASYGLLETGTGRLVGVAVLSVPVNRAVLTGAFPTLEPYRQSADLGRLVLLDEVPANAETWFLARAFRHAHERGYRGVVSFADPLPRRTLDGRLVLAGHVGVVYQAGNAVYTGRGTPRTLLLLPDATVLNSRTLQKIRAQEPGHAYAEQRLCAAGARPRRPDQDPRAWLEQALRDARVRRVRHHGPHRYLFALGSARERRRLPLGHPGQPARPKTPDPAPRCPGLQP